MSDEKKSEITQVISISEEDFKENGVPVYPGNVIEIVIESDDDIVSE